MRVQNGCEYVVLEGSILDPKITSNESSIRKSRKEHADSLSEDGMVYSRHYVQYAIRSRKLYSWWGV